MAIELKHCEPVHVPMLLRSLEQWHRVDADGVDQYAAAAPLLGLTRNPSLGSVWFIEHRGMAVGYAVVEMFPARGFLWQEAALAGLYLIPAARGIGIGRVVRRVLRELLTGQGVGLLAGDQLREDLHWEMVHEQPLRRTDVAA
jgi:GNAT superfamily N-acetyltransferase